MTASLYGSGCRHGNWELVDCSDVVTQESDGETVTVVEMVKTTWRCADCGHLQIRQEPRRMKR